MRFVGRFVRPAWISEPVPLAAAFAAAAVSVLAIFVFVYLVPHVKSADSKLGGGITQAAPCREGIKVFGDPAGLDQPECVKQATYISRSCARHPHCLRPLLKSLIASLQKGDTRGITRDGGHRKAGPRAQQQQQQKQQDTGGGDALLPSITFEGGGEVGHGHGGGNEGTTTTGDPPAPSPLPVVPSLPPVPNPVPPGNPLLDPLMPLLDPLLNP